MSMISAKVYKLNHRKALDKLKFKGTIYEKLAAIFQSVCVTKAKDRHTEELFGIKGGTTEICQLGPSPTKGATGIISRHGIGSGGCGNIPMLIS